MRCQDLLASHPLEYNIYNIGKFLKFTVYEQPGNMHYLPVSAKDKIAM